MPLTKRLKATPAVKILGKWFKICPACKIDKSGEDFRGANDRGAPKGRCKPCQKEYEDQWRDANRARFNELHAVYRTINRRKLR